jgi:hypothetical protein
MTFKINKNTTKKEFVKLLATIKRSKKTNGIDLSKHCGVLKLKKDALQIQKEMRNDWE